LSSINIFNAAVAKQQKFIAFGKPCTLDFGILLQALD